MLCAISGNDTTDAVVSPKSGGVFDRKLAQTYVSTSGKDPLNDEPLSVEELIPIANGGVPVVTPPKPASFHSIPTMLAAFQNEWDALALEVFTLRKQLQSTREELSMALYRYDAAVRVAARATSERDEAKMALSQVSESFAANSANLGANTAENPENTENTAETGPNNEIAPKTSEIDEFASKISSARASLFALHKQSKVSLPVTPQTGISVSETTEILKIPSPQKLFVNGPLKIVTSDSKTLLLPENKEFASYDAVAFLNEANMTHPVGVSDQKLHFLNTNEFLALSIDNIQSIITHPSEPYLVAITKDGKWVLAGKSGILHVSPPQYVISAADIHVDGALLGLASAGEVVIQDLTTFAPVSTINTDFSGISKIQFALNGYWLLISGYTESRSSLQIYDLRKNFLVHTFNVSKDTEFTIDPSCQMLVTCDISSQMLNVHLYSKKGKKWTENVFSKNCGSIHALQMASSAEEVQSTKTVKVAALSGDKLVHFEFSLK
ncbi:hypothetical protein OXX69_008047 [Metschnikowia pulcherrima]